VFRRRTDHRTGNIANDFERLRVELRNMRQIAARDCDPLRLDILAIAFEIL
jgi:hypothetical protein